MCSFSSIITTTPKCPLSASVSSRLLRPSASKGLLEKREEAQNKARRLCTSATGPALCCRAESRLAAISQVYFHDAVDARTPKLKMHVPFEEEKCFKMKLRDMKLVTCFEETNWSSLGLHLIN